MGVFFGWLILSIIVACIASSKGRSGFGWFCLSMLVSPLISVIILLCVGDSQEKKEEDLNTAMDIIERRKSNNKLPEQEYDETEVDSMSQENAICELKKAKDLLDLQVISQKEYDAKKIELLPFLRDDYPSQESAVDIVEEPITTVEDIPQKVDGSDIETEDKLIEHRWYQNTLIQVFIAAFVSLIIVCLIGFFIRSSSNMSKPKNKPTNTEYVAKPLPHSHSKKHKNKSIDEILKSEDSENKSFSKSEKRVVEQFISLYKELLKFKNEYEFVQIGFAPNGKYYNWLEKVHKFETDANADILVRLRIVPNDLEALGMEYVVSHGKESEGTQLFRNTIDGAIRQYEESQNTTPVTQQTKTSNDKSTSLGKWKLTVPGISGQIIVEIVQKGNQYVSIENGKNKPLRKVGDKLYLVDSDSGEYYRIVNGNLRMCDNLGDFTDTSGWKVTKIK